MKRKNGKMLRGGFDWTLGFGKKPQAQASEVVQPQAQASEVVQPQAQPSTNVQPQSQASASEPTEVKKGWFSGGKKRKSRKNKKSKSQKKR